MPEPTKEQMAFMSMPLIGVLYYVHDKMEKHGKGKCDMTIPFKDCKFTIRCEEVKQDAK